MHSRIIMSASPDVPDASYQQQTDGGGGGGGAHEVEWDPEALGQVRERELSGSEASQRESRRTTSALDRSARESTRTRTGEDSC